MVGLPNLFLTVEAMQVGMEYGMDLHRLASIMETGSGRNITTKDWEQGKATFAHFAKSPELIKLAVDLSRKDLKHVQDLARQASVSCPLLNRILDAFNLFEYEEIEKSWNAVTKAK